MRKLSFQADSIQMVSQQQMMHDTPVRSWTSVTQFAHEYAPRLGRKGFSSRSILIILLAIIFHACVLYLLLAKTSTLQQTKGQHGQNVAMLFFPPSPHPSITPPKPTPLKPQPVAKPPPRASHTITTPAAPTAPLASRLPPPPVTAPSITVQPQEEEDMMARIEANRKRRAQEAQALAQAAQRDEAEDANQHALAVAKANFASSQRKAGGDKEDTGGVFQIRNQSYHTAEISFRGWNTTMRRMWPQKYEVEQGQEADIEIAIVKKMIEVIRKYKDGDFQWESHRLGRTVTLSARGADSQALQQFLLREFFPNYRASVTN